MALNVIRKYKTKHSLFAVPDRTFWAWLNIIFNRVDDKRIEVVGPDRACAEWLVRNGAQVTFEGEGPTKDYNLLVAAAPNARKRLVAIDAENVPITHHGFAHFKGCEHIASIKFHKCSYISDKAVEKLTYLKDPLKHLHISSCDDVTDKGVIMIGQLRNLSTLTLYDLRVKDWKACKEALGKNLPNCDMKIESAPK